ncbi:hypothetical protein [Asticcacaulis sp. EMRT-3]|uniref:hypothetical protein n=1 Tax=Asticcacaulis sp. EMRT-3 TaxID=3040349 RepID=UPI0024AFCC84|nr:hypothetical protein [Asticcacaulis sp. EMRT-3]MDI7774811.1 hypothetical protein [Asticcacaulis sp. EMRT-3]
MASGFHVSARIDEDERLIVFRMSGLIDSRILIDRWIDTYSGLAEPWLYNRLLDYRRSEGIVEFDEIIRFAHWWDERTAGVDYTSKVAVIVNNSLDLVRVNVVSRQFPRDIRKSFMTLDEGLSWLGEAPGDLAIRA